MTNSDFIPAPTKPLISFEELERLVIRVGNVLSVDGLEKSDKPVRIRVDLGDHTRTTLAGMKNE